MNPSLPENDMELTLYGMMPEFKYKIDKEIALDPHLPKIWGNSLQIKQIVDNLIKNAVEAMEQSARKHLTIKTSGNGESNRITVADTGEGIKQQNISSIFLPGYTTKPVEKGTGLGLASVKSMVDAYSGEITVESAVGQGTVFNVNLPVGRAMP